VRGLDIIVADSAQPTQISRKEDMFAGHLPANTEYSPCVAPASWARVTAAFLAQQSSSPAVLRLLFQPRQL
jgi:hypothetical protein